MSQLFRKILEKKHIFEWSLVGSEAQILSESLKRYCCQFIRNTKEITYENTNFICRISHVHMMEARVVLWTFNM